MDSSYPSKLCVWEGWPRTADSPPAAPPQGCIFPGSPTPAELAAREALRPVSENDCTPDDVVPYTLPWFQRIESQRYGRRGWWLPRLLEFAKHGGETLLGLGNGLGTDWLQYARHGASVVVCSPSADQLALARRHFELRAVPGRFLHADPSAMPLENASIDVVCVSSLLHEVRDPPAVAEEVYRVLKPGGKVLVVAPAKYDIDYWYHRLFPWQRWLGWNTPVADAPAVRFTARRLRKLFGRFVEYRVHKRHLRRPEVPHVWRWAPVQVLERLMGRFLILKAFKPLSAAIAVQAAA